MSALERLRRRPRAWLSNWLGPRPAIQLAVLVTVVVLVVVLGSNIAATMARIGLTPGFGFLERAANFEIGESAIPFRAGDSYARAIAVGVLNTAKVAVVSCILATVLGVALALMRLAGHPVLSGLVRWSIEVVRNTPLLLQLFFWIGLAHALPPPRRAVVWFDCVFLTNRGVYLPSVVIAEGSWMAITAIAAILLGWLALMWRGRARGPLAPLPLGLVAMLVLAVVIYASGFRISLHSPAVQGFNIQGGTSLTPEFAALLVGLTVKFAAIFAEIVRAGILSVRREQWDAARALGLSELQIIRLVVLPQALRVITPLATSCYLDVIKDSSLAVAIGYPDLMNITNTTANTTGQALEALLIVVALYLVLNLSVSAVMNVYNARVAMRGGRPA
ncbi:amino acid ABC transporter permease [Rhodopseudomonas palustris]|uniref:amino acid ABC transporter permease n=1 Tax=Rhodopseudomonas palustris TaxID=1076 RepID=UPI000D1A76C2|nr:ABC transporter permease subunit [Rhodopseudomonas palustris]AVT76429.1 amino acid ABC transporter permease [Rhodopseudomonas palustris]